MRKQKITPIINLLKERLAFNELVIDDSTPTTGADIADSLTLVSFGIQPSVIITEGDKGVWTVRSGGTFVRALLYFVNGQMPYPTDGAMAECQGLFFSGLCRAQQRTLSEHAINVLLCIDYDEAQIEQSLTALKKFS